MTTELTVTELPPARYPEWNRLVADSLEGSPYSTPEYLDILCRVAGGRFRILAASRGETLLGGVALYERSARMGLVVAPRYLLYYNGLLTKRSTSKYPSEHTSQQVRTLAALAEALGSERYARIHLRSRGPLHDVRPFLMAGWTAEATYSYVVAIDDLKSAWGRVEQNLRRFVGRCEREGVTLSDDDDFDSLYRLHEQTRDRKGTLLYLPRHAFRNFFDLVRAAGLGRLYHARLPDGRAIASQLVLAGAHPVTHSVCAGADADFLKIGANAFLRWKVFEDLSRRGYAANDLTDAALNPVTHFKSQLGGRLEIGFLLRRRDSLPLRAAAGARRLVRLVTP